MGSIQLPDINLAVVNFLQHFESLAFLPLIADSEMGLLFGDEVTAALSELERYNQQENLCHTCRGRCCTLVKCEFYLPLLSRCPVHHLRPLLCRLHFCHQFAPPYQELVKAVGDIFLESVIAGERINRVKARLLDSPPLSKLAPQMVSGVKPFLTAFSDGRLNESAALESIADAVKTCFRIL